MTTFPKTASVTFQPKGIYTGTILRSDPALGRVWLTIPRVAPGVEFGPCRVASDPLPDKGDPVAVMFVEGRTDEVVVLGIFKRMGSGRGIHVIAFTSDDLPVPAHEYALGLEIDTGTLRMWINGAWEEAGFSTVSTTDGTTINFSGAGTSASPLTAEAQEIANSHIAANAAISLSKLAQISTARILGNVSGVSATPQQLTAAQTKTFLAMAISDITGLQSALDLKASIAYVDALDGTITAGDLYLSASGNVASFNSNGITLAGAGTPTAVRWKNGVTEIASIEVADVFGANLMLVEAEDGVFLTVASTSLNITSGTVNLGGADVSIDQDLTVDGVLYTAQPRAKVRHGSTQSLATGTPDILSFDTETYDNAGLHSVVTNNGRITVPAGTPTTAWTVGATVSFAPNASGRRVVTLLKNGSAITGGTVQVAPAPSGNTIINLVTDVEASASDYFQVQVEQTSGGSLNVNIADTSFWARMVG